MIRKLIKGLFPAKKEKGPTTPVQSVTDTRNPQIFFGALVKPPEFTKGLDPSSMIKVLQSHTVCEYAPKIEFQRLYYTGGGQRSARGDLEIAYEGISVACSAIKNFGLAIAREDGFSQAYRYAGLNHIYACCCSDPKKCRFYMEAKAEDSQVSHRFRSPGKFDRKPEEEPEE